MCLVVATFGYIVISMLHGVTPERLINPDRFRFNFTTWSPTLTYYFVAAMISLPSLIASALAPTNTNHNDRINQIFNLTEYERKSLFDSVMSHYTNVATVGLFITLAIYYAKNFVDTASLQVTIATVLFAVTLILYMIFLSKLVIKFNSLNCYRADASNQENGETMNPSFMTRIKPKLKWIAFLIFFMVDCFFIHTTIALQQTKIQCHFGANDEAYSCK